MMRLVEKGKAAPDEDAEALMALVQGKKTNNLAVVDAYDTYTRPYKREAVESLLLANCTDEEVEQATGVMRDIVAAYRRFFFNTEVFRDNLDRIEYGMTYTGMAWGKELKDIAVRRGKEALKVKLNGVHKRITPDVALNSVRTMSYILSQEAMNRPLDSSVCKEARAWAQLCLNAAEDKVKDNVGNMDKFVIKLVTTNAAATSEDTSGLLPEDIAKD